MLRLTRSNSFIVAKIRAAKTLVRFGEGTRRPRQTCGRVERVDAVEMEVLRREATQGRGRK